MRLAEDLDETVTHVYLCGPWGSDFEQATADLRDSGYRVVSPHEHEVDEVSGLRAALSWGAEAVLSTHAVVVLPGWETSPGCGVDVTVASALGRPIVDLDTALG